MASQKRLDPVYEEALLLKRIEFVQQLKAAIVLEDSVVSQTLAAYGDVLDDIFLDVAVDVHRAVRTGQDDLSDVGKAPVQSSALQTQAVQASWPLREQTGKHRVDVFGQTIRPDKVFVKCPECGQQVVTHRHGPQFEHGPCSVCTRKSSYRFAPHLEKCLGKGRAAGRVASRRIAGKK